MVTQAHIDSLREGAQFFPPYTRQEIEDDLLEMLRAGLPDWDSRADTILRRSLPLIAEQVKVWTDTNRSQLLNGMVLFATGVHLDILGLGPPPVLRGIGEADDPYRLRIINASLRRSLGSLGGVEGDTRALNAEITDVLAVVSPNRQDIHTFCVKGVAELLTTEEKAVINTHFLGREAAIAGVVITAVDPTLVPVKIKVSGVFDRNLYAEALVEERIRTSVYAYITEQQRIGNTWYASSLCAASDVRETVNAVGEFRVPMDGIAFTGPDDEGVVRSELTATTSYTQTHLYHCPQDEENVIITLRGIDDA